MYDSVFRNTNCNVKEVKDEVSGLAWPLQEIRNKVNNNFSKRDGTVNSKFLLWFNIWVRGKVEHFSHQVCPTAFEACPERWYEINKQTHWRLTRDQLKQREAGENWQLVWCRWSFAPSGISVQTRPPFPCNQLHKHMRLLFVPEGVNNGVIAKSVVLGRKSTLDKSVSMFPEESMGPHEHWTI